ncbi:MAG: aldo/keto reductase [Limimaricola sp.]
MTRGADRLVLGTLGIGSQPAQVAGYVPINDNEAFAVLDAAWALGIRVAETALSYGSGTALRRLAAWQAARGRGFSVVAKLGRPVAGGRIRPDCTPEGLLRELDTYLAYGLEVTGVLVKDPPPEDIPSGNWEHSLSRIAARHPGLALGFASHNLAACGVVPARESPAIAEIEANAANWLLAEASVTHLKRSGFETWAMQPLAGGLLTAAPGLHARLHPADWRNVYPEETLERKRDFAALAADRLRAAAPNVSVAASAHAFLLSQPSVGRVVIGPRLVRHLNDIARALALSHEHLEDAT